MPVLEADCLAEFLARGRRSLATAESRSLTSQTPMSVRFWGVRGSIACPGQSTSRYGGNTSCVEVRCGNKLVIFDAGTGLRELGNALKSSATIEANILLSHCHIDHVCGLPFFAPCYSKTNRMRMWAGNLLPRFHLEQVIGQLMAPPLFPIQYDVFKAELEFNDFHAGEIIRPHDDLLVRTVRLNHPDGATGYRLEYEGRSVAYVTDHEQEADNPRPDLVAFLSGVDVLIFDCTYTDEELPSHVGWGHSSWRQGVRLAAAANVKTFCTFHHDPDHDDAFLDRIAAELGTLRDGALVAKEGLVLQL